MAEQDVCLHLDSIGEVTKEDLLQKSKVRFSYSEAAVRCKIYPVVDGDWNKHFSCVVLM